MSPTAEQNQSAGSSQARCVGWDANGARAPELWYVAWLVLAQPAPVSICERIDSEFAFIKDPQRNRLIHTKANELDGLFHTLSVPLHAYEKASLL